MSLQYDIQNQQLELDFGLDYITSSDLVTMDSSYYSTNITTVGSISSNITNITANIDPFLSNIYDIGSITLGNVIPNTQASLHVSGDAEFEGDIKVRGVSLSERLDTIENRLNILRPNVDLEEKWEKLRTLGEEYRRLEAEIIDKQRIWNALKD